MPKVGMKEYPYTAKGKAMAMAEAKRTGKPVKKAAKRVAKKSTMVRKKGM